MDTGIGTTLRDARNRRKVDLAQAEAATKIRIRYLRAIESEDWDVLPEGPYTRAFVRTYANYLGLDGERLAEEYKRLVAPAASVERAPRVEPVASPERHRRRRVSGRAWIVVLLLAGVVVLVGIGLAGGGDNGVGVGEKRAPEPGRQSSSVQARRDRSTAVRLTAKAEVWVCLLAGSGERLIDGEILEAGAEAGPFHADRYTAAFGNGEFELTIDGKPADTPPSAGPVGYEIGSGGALTPLEEGERPDCT